MRELVHQQESLIFGIFTYILYSHHNYYNKTIFSRGPNGVWTLESKGLKPSINVSFDNAEPTRTHMALKKMTETKHVKYIVTQNIDGLHLRSGISREYIAELHGNMYTEKCNTCDRYIIFLDS